MRSRAVSLPRLCCASMRACAAAERGPARGAVPACRGCPSCARPCPDFLGISGKSHTTAAGMRAAVGPRRIAQWPRLGHEAPGMNSHAPAPDERPKPLQEALALHRQGKHELAMQRYVAILQQNPSNVDALYYVAMLAIQQEQIAEGLKVIERALDGRAAAGAAAQSQGPGASAAEPGRRRAAQLRPRHRDRSGISPTPMATAARCWPRWARHEDAAPTSTARWRCGPTTPRTSATARACWPISAGSSRRWRTSNRAIALMPAMAPAYSTAPTCWRGSAAPPRRSATTIGRSRSSQTWRRSHAGAWPRARRRSIGPGEAKAKLHARPVRDRSEVRRDRRWRTQTSNKTSATPRSTVAAACISAKR